MRNISFAHTTQQIRNQTKGVTRRYGWLDAEPGELLQGIVKGQGLKTGERVEKLWVIDITDVRREPLTRLLDDPEYGRAEMILEGFPGLNPLCFIDTYFRHRDDVVTRIAFTYTVTLGQSQTTFMSQHVPHMLRRAGEDFERERSDDPRLDWLTCSSCGEMTLVQSAGWYLRELSTDEATSALSQAFQQQVKRL